MSRNSKRKFTVPKLLEKQSNFSSWILKDLKDTISFGKYLIQNHPTIRLLLLEGELGAGKTSLVKGIGQGMGIKEPITSPTFALAQHYASGQRSLIHLDLYRLDNPKIANELFLQEEEGISNLKDLMVVEWPERLNLDLPEAWLAKLKYTEDNQRIIQLFPPKPETMKLRTSS